MGSTLALGSAPAVEDVVKAIADVAATLASLAEQGISHRDIKPANLYRYNHAYAIGDFGLVDYPNKDALTAPGRRLGPTFFLAPEMLTESATAAAGPADVYSLAKTLWVLAADQNFPPQGEQRLDTPQVLLSSMVAHPKAYLLDRLIERATRHSPDDRPTMAQVRDELMAWLAPGVAPTASTSIDDLGARILAATSPAQHAAERWQVAMVNASETLKQLLQRLAPVRDAYVQAGLGDGSTNVSTALVHAFKGADAGCWQADVQVAYMEPHKARGISSGFAVFLYADERMRIVAAHLIWHVGGTGPFNVLWSEEWQGHVGSAQVEQASDALCSGLIAALRSAMEKYAGVVASQPSP